MPNAVGDVLLEVNGQEYEITSVEYTDDTGRRVFDLMTATGNKINTFRTNAKVTGTFEFPVPGDDGPEEPSWRSITNGRIVVVDPHGAFREAIDNVGVEEVSPAFRVGEAAVRTVRFHGILAASGLSA